jgi:hypothetical protein
MLTTTSPGHSHGDPGNNSQPATIVKNAAGDDKLRRRLSSIFHRPIAGIATGRRRFDRGWRPLKIQGKSCQSPRAQRWCRLAATS